MKNTNHPLRFVSLALALVANPATASDSRLTVAVSVLPQVEIVQKVGGALVDVIALVPPGSSPDTYEPTPKQLAALIDAELWLRIGIPFETAIAERLHAVAPDVPIIDGCAGIERHPIDEGDHDLHTHGALDPHIWLDPTLVAVHASTLSDALCIAAPDDCSTFKRNLAAYRTELAAADLRIRESLAPFSGAPLFVFHPAYGYLARRYGLVQVAVEVDGKVPTGRRLAALVDRARASGARALYVQPQFAGAGARAAAAAMKVDVVEIDPLAADLAANLERMAATIVNNLREAP